MPLNRDEVVKTLELLKRKHPPREVFGVLARDYELNPTLSLEEVEAFELKHGISLPRDYRDFILNIGNGGSEPLGPHPLGEYQEYETRTPWCEGENIGTLSQPFQFQDAWNLPAEFFEQQPDLPDDMPEEERDRLANAWEEKVDEEYFHPRLMNGAIPLCDLGCGLEQWLVVTGVQRGFVWEDRRAEYAGIQPLTNPDGAQVTFTDWYADALQKCKDRPIRQNRSEAIWNANHALPEWLFLPTLAIVLAAGLSTARLLGVQNKLAFLAIALVCCFASVAVLSGFDKWLVERRKLRNATKNDEVA